MNCLNTQESNDDIFTIIHKKNIPRKIQTVLNVEFAKISFIYISWSEDVRSRCNGDGRKKKGGFP